MAEYLSVTEYAKKTGKDPGNIRRMLASGRLQGEKIGNQWVIPEDSEYPTDKRESSGRYRNWRRRSVLAKNRDLFSSVNKMTGDLSEIYGENLAEIILYGSYARGTQTEESDLDIALILRRKPSHDETSQMLDCVSSYELECGKVLSVIDIDEKKYQQWQATLPFYKNIRKEGIPLWTAEM